MWGNKREVEEGERGFDFLMGRGSSTGRKLRERKINQAGSCLIFVAAEGPRGILGFGHGWAEGMGRGEWENFG